MDLLKLASRRALAFALALFVLCLTPAVSAQGFKWWQDDTYKRELGLTTEQSTRLEDIFQKSAPSLRQLKEKLDKAQVAFDRIVERGDDSTVLVQVDALEGALGTPVQAAVKREDEQAFAELNAANLMFCEDAARRVAAVLSSDPRVEHYDATVSHYESLHPHDAVARVSG